MFSHLTNSTLHHAYLIEGDATVVIPQLESFLESVGVTVAGNPNVFVGSYSSLLIDDAHDLRTRQLERTEDGGKKIFIISAEFINHPAQNALLKTFEEPAPNTHFFVIMPSISSLYETLVSRFSVIKGEGSVKGISEAQEFLSCPITDRLQLIADLVKSHEDDENSGALRSHATELVSNIEKILYSKNKTSPELSPVFIDLASARQYLSIAGASVKMILEQLALVVPVIK